MFASGGAFFWAFAEPFFGSISWAHTAAAGDGAPERPHVTDHIFSALTASCADHGAWARARPRGRAPGAVGRRPGRAAPRSARRGRHENAPPVENIVLTMCYI